MGWGDELPTLARFVGTHVEARDSFCLLGVRLRDALSMIFVFFINNLKLSAKAVVSVWYFFFCPGS